MKFKITKKHLRNGFYIFYLYEHGSNEYIDSHTAPYDSCALQEKAIQNLKDTAKEYKDKGILIEEFEL